MARMIPDIQYAAFPEGNRSEKQVYQALSNYLPKEWKVYHSQPWIRDPDMGSGRKPSGEIDFLICVPGGHLIVLEVKGGKIGYDTERAWYQVRDGEKKNISPVEQARESMHNLRIRIQQSDTLGYFPGITGFAVAFAHMHSSENYKLPDTVQQGVFLFDDDFRENHLESRLDNLVEDWKSRVDKKVRNLKHEEKKVLYEEILPTRFEVPEVQRSRLGTEEHLMRLQKWQQNYLDLMSSWNRAFIKGYAGTGKTLLSLEKASRLASKGKDVLWLCYSHLLRNQIEREFDTSRFDTFTYHDFARQFIREKTGTDVVKEGDTNDEKFWNKDIPEQLLKNAPENPPYDALIIDEAQDIDDDYFISLDDFIPEDGILWAFYDPVQNIFGDDLPEWLQEQDPYSMLLPQNLRNSREISRAAADISDMEYPDNINDLGPEGEKPRVDLANNLKEAKDRLRKGIYRATNEMNYDPEDIVVLGYARMNSESIPFRDGDTLGYHEIVDARKRRKENTEEPYPFEDKEIRYYTIQSFKGLEEQVVFLFDPTFNKDQNLDYTGASRARYLLWIITRDPEIISNLDLPSEYVRGLEREHN